MLKLSNIRIPVRIAIACLLPLLAFTGFAVKELLDRRAIVADMDAIAVVAEAAPMIAAARARAAERARRLRSDLSNSKGKSFADAMRNQRPLTDKALEAWNQRVAEYSKSDAGTKFASNLDTAKSRLAELGQDAHERRCAAPSTARR